MEEGRLALNPHLQLFLRTAALSALLALLLSSAPRFASSMLEEPVIAAPDDLKGGSTVGFRYAYVGGWMLTVSQLYAVLKPLVGGLGLRVRLSRWLDLHCALNVAGFTLILLHAGFPYAFGYFNPFSRLNPWMGLEGLVAIRGLLTWLVLAAASSGLGLRHLGRGRVKRVLRRVHVSLTPAVYLAGMTHIFISTFFPSSR